MVSDAVPMMIYAPETDLELSAGKLQIAAVTRNARAFLAARAQITSSASISASKSRSNPHMLGSTVAASAVETSAATDVRSGMHDGSGTWEKKGGDAEAPPQFTDTLGGKGRRPVGVGISAWSLLAPETTRAGHEDAFTFGVSKFELVAALSPPVTPVSRPAFDSESACRSPLIRFTPHEMALQSPVTRPPFTSTISSTAIRDVDSQAADFSSELMGRGATSSCSPPALASACDIPVTHGEAGDRSGAQRAAWELDCASGSAPGLGAEDEAAGALPVSHGTGLQISQKNTTPTCTVAFRPHSSQKARVWRLIMRAPRYADCARRSVDCGQRNLGYQGARNTNHAKTFQRGL